MKKSAIILLLVAIVLYFHPNFLDGDTLKGSGVVTTKVLDIKHISEISQLSSIDVQVFRSDSEYVLIEADDNIIPLIECKVEQNKLEISLKRTNTVTGINPTKCQVKVYVKQLNYIRNSGSGDFVLNKLNNSELTVENSGSGDFVLDGLVVQSVRIKNSGSGDFLGKNLKLENLEIKNSGSGDFKVQGLANQLDIQNSGSGDFNSVELTCPMVRITNKGSGDFNVNAQKELYISNTGSGDIEYKGSPKVVKL